MVGKRTACWRDRVTSWKRSCYVPWVRGRASFFQARQGTRISEHSYNIVIIIQGAFAIGKVCRRGFMVNQKRENGGASVMCAVIRSAELHPTWNSW